MKPSCLIIDEMHPSIIPLLEEAGMAVSYQPEIKAAEVKTALKGYQVLIVRSKLHVDAGVLAEADALKVIARAGAGTDNIDEAALAARNIKLICAPEGNRDAVAEFTVGLLLSLFRKIAKADREVREMNWQREANRGEELAGKTIGIIGFGNMGKAFARRLQCFNCEVLAYDTDPGRVVPEIAQKVSLEGLYERADVVSFHIPYVPKNLHFANQAFFERFEKPIWVINTARGEIMDYSAVVANLKSGQIRGAALDVMENEKLHTLTEVQKQNFEYLSNADNVILTPHIAGWTHESYVKINETLISKLKGILL